MGPSDDLRAYLARLLGWARERAIDQALRSIELAASYRAALVMCGAGDLVPIAYSLHRRILGDERPFVVCDPRRGNTRASARSPANHVSGAAAFDAAPGGAVCVRASRLPRDFPSLAARVRSADDVLLVVCTDERDDEHGFLVKPAPINLPPLAGRADEPDRVIAEYAADASAVLRAPRDAFTDADHAWVREHAVTSLDEIEKATLRLVAIRTSRNMSAAAARFEMAPVSLSRWVGRRHLPTRVTARRGLRA